MKKTLLLLCVLVTFCATSNIYSQDYFQQEVNYKIDVRLNDSTHSLSAFETIGYINNSPDDLDFIYFHLWPNAYKNNNTALAKQKFENGNWLKLFKLEYQRGYIDSLDFKVNGKTAKFELDKENIDIGKLILDKPLKSGGKITITTPFYLKIPKGVTSRLGHIKTSYQLVQWYPKPAVYDKYGWHQFPYLNMGEFYSEFGSFDVSITLPENYVVGATGDLQTQSEIEWLNKLAAKTAKIKTFEKDSMSFPTSSKKYKTIRYKQSNVHDFAWFTDKRFHVLKDEVTLPNSNKKVNTWAMFTNDEAHLWLKANEYIKDALTYYSGWYGDYPYNNCTAILASQARGGGMEYPNITVIGKTGTDMALEMVIMHEVGHNWLYGILGFNERDYAWMDEGINSFTEARYMRKKYGVNDKFYKMFGKDKIARFFEIDKLRYKKMHEIDYLVSARQNKDQHASLPAGDYANGNYGGIIYHKVSRAFDYLLYYLGEEKFDAAMQSFYGKWQFKHPYPDDLRTHFENATGEDLSWFFDDLLKTTKKVDYKIKNIKDNKVLIENKGMINSPVFVSGIKDNKIIFTERFKGFEGKQWLSIESKNEVDLIKIDGEEAMLELDRKNNMMHTSGLFRKTEPLRMKFFGVLENTDRTQINFLPLATWNNYNQLMLGAVFYNSILPQKKFEYQLMPMYSFGANDLAGGAAIAYHIFPYNAKIRAVDLNLSGIQYAYNDEKGDNFQKIKAEAVFHFRNNYARSLVTNKLIVNSILASNPEDIMLGESPDFIQIYNLKFKHKNPRAYNPYDFAAGIEMGDGFVKSTIETNYKFIYQYKKGLNVRIFGGAFLHKKDDLSSLYNFRLSGTRGIEDYTYSETFLGRYEDINDKKFLAYQFIPNDGAFTTFTNHGSTNEWMLAVNLSSSLPLPDKIPLQVYVNAATYGSTVPVQDYNNLESFSWEAGVKISFAKKAIEIFLPLVMSNDLDKLNDENTNNYFERIRFSLKINQNNPFRLIKNAF